MKKFASALVGLLTMLLITMSAMVIEVQSIVADTSTAGLPSNCLRVLEAGGDNPSSLSDFQDVFLYDTSKNFDIHQSALREENPKPYLFYGNKWNFNNTVEWIDFAKGDNDSAEVVIGVNNGNLNSLADIKGLIDDNGGELVGMVSMGGEIRAFIADIPLVAVSSFVTEVRDIGLSRYVEPNIVFELDLVPNDPDWPEQWGPRKMETDYAWNTTFGDPSIVVAVVDSGVDWNHPDLAANIWNNTDEIVDGIDNDDNGFVDDIRGWDFVDTNLPVWPGEDGTVRDNDPMDFHGHGTHCAGIAAAVTNNSAGIAGVGWNCKIMPVRAGFKEESGRGRFELDDVAAAIIYATDKGANVVSMSFGGPFPSELLYDALKYAYDSGVLLVAAAGNEASSKKIYPAAYSEVMAVTATDEYDNPARFTNFGGWVELAAPGVNIYSTVFDDSYASKSGTSMSAPHVAGLAALAWSVFPNATRDWIRVLLRNAADDLGNPGFDAYYGWGRINARKAVKLVRPNHDVAIMNWEAPHIPIFVEPSTTVSINTTLFNFGANNETDITVQLLVNGSLIDSATINFLETDTFAIVNCSWTRMADETYNLTSYVLPVLGEDFTANNVITTILPHGPLVYVDPKISYATVGQTFSINVSIANATDLYAFDLTLVYDTTILDILGATIQPFLKEPTYVVGNEINEEDGLYWLAITSLTGPPGVDGSGPLVTLDFKVMGANNCSLCLYDTILVDTTPIEIPHYVQHGYFEYRPLEHDVAAFVDAPRHIVPGYSAWLNATVLNAGLNNETDVELQLLINGSMVDSEVIDFLQANSSQTLSYYWTPPVVEARYNVTAYATPVSDENFTLNNMESARVIVSCIIRVPSDFPTIQMAIDAASPGDTINVSAGTYYEHLTVDKSGLTLVGEENSISIIDGSGTDTVIHVRADNVDITAFTIQNAFMGVLMEFCEYNAVCGNTIMNTTIGIYVFVSNTNTISDNTMSDNDVGIVLDAAGNNTIGDNKVSNCQVGINLDWATRNTISGNTVSGNGKFGISFLRTRYNTLKGNIIVNNTVAGIRFYGSWYGSRLCYNNTIISNVVSNNGIGMKADYSENNIVYHNNFINNIEQVFLGTSFDIWDNGYEGNYWSDYAGEDLDGDGIGDTLLPHQGVDNYPFMSPYMEGDVNHDATVNIVDGVTIGVAFGTKPSDPNWNPHADLNEDATITITDIVIFAIHFGETW